MKTFRQTSVLLIGAGLFAAMAGAQAGDEKPATSDQDLIKSATRCCARQR